MTDATYRIEIRPDPHSKMFPFQAYITRLADDALCSIEGADSHEQAEQKGRDWIVREVARPASATLYVGDDGQDAEVPL